MLSIFTNSWKVKEIRKKIIFTLFILAIVRLGVHIYLPGINVQYVKTVQNMYSTGTLYNIIAGGANSSLSIFAMGIGPYITSSIIMQLLTIAIPKLEQLSKEGEEGRKKIQNYTRYGTVILAAIQAFGMNHTYRSMMISDSIWVYAANIISMVAGTVFIMWLAELITEKGITNGSSMIIFVNIVSSLPSAIRSLYYYIISGTTGALKVAGVLIILLIVIAVIVFVHEGERKLPVQYSSKMVGHRQYGGQSSFIPIKVNTAGVIAIIFAISILQFPQTIGQFFNTGETFEKVTTVLNMTHPVGAALYVILILFFSFFYTSIVINPNEMAENMKKNGGFIPGIRPGQPTSKYISAVVDRVTLIGAVCFAVLALVPIILQWIFKIQVGFGGTTLIIVVGVALDIVKALESQLLMRHYKGFLKD